MAPIGKHHKICGSSRRPIPQTSSSSASLTPTSSPLSSFLFIFCLFISTDAIFLTHRLLTGHTTTTNGGSSRSSSQDFIPPSSSSYPMYRSLFTRSIEPFMSAALSAFAIVPTYAAEYVPHSVAAAQQQQHPYSTFTRFIASSSTSPSVAFPSFSARSNLYGNHNWNILPFSVGHWCDQRIIAEPEYQRCRSDAAINWRAAEHNRDGRAAIDNMRSCCFFWSVLSCVEDALRRRCALVDRSTLDFFRLRRNELRVSLGSSPYGICYNYPHNAFRCTLQSWVIFIAIMILVFFVLAVIISIVWIMVVRKSNKLQNDNDDSTGRSFHLFRARRQPPPSQQSQRQTKVQRVRSPSRSARVPSPPPSHPMQQYASRQISL